jgi:hypothetical protein
LNKDSAQFVVDPTHLYCRSGVPAKAVLTEPQLPSGWHLKDDRTLREQGKLGYYQEGKNGGSALSTF